VLHLERDIGLLLPCNVIVYEQEGSTYVSTILPTVAMEAIEHDELQSIAMEIEEKLKKAINNV
jgi:uncharacterized protein (DUF302 family)